MESRARPGGARGKVLVTGSTGHLGANLLRRLIGDGEEVRVLVRPGADDAALAGLDVERAVGDLRDADAVRRAAAGCARVYHCAAIVSTVDGTARARREIFDTNVMGTRNLLTAAREAGAAKVVVSGSFSALGHDLEHPGRAVDETQILYPFGRIMPYSRTKVLVEQECLRAHADGLAVVVAVSTGVVGPHDYKPSRFGRTLCDYANGRLRFILPGSHEFVAARDIADGHVLAMEKGRSGQSYIFSTAFLSLDEIVAMFAEAAGDQGRCLRLSPRLFLPFAEVASFCLDRLRPSFNQRFTPHAIRRLIFDRRADIAKARNELGYEPTNIRDAIREAYEFHVVRGAIRRPRAAVPVPGAALGETARPR